MYFLIIHYTLLIAILCVTSICFTFSITILLTEFKANRKVKTLVFLFSSPMVLPAIVSTVLVTFLLFPKQWEILKKDYKQNLKDARLAAQKQ